jgi:hypothetical protein
VVLKQKYLRDRPTEVLKKRVGNILRATLRDRGYVHGRTLTRAAPDGRVSFPTLKKYLAGDIPEAEHGKFRRFLRALGIPVRRFKGLLPPPTRPSTRLGRLLLGALTSADRTMSEAARRARMPVGSVWAWVWRGTPPRPDALAAFLERNGIDARLFGPFLRGRSDAEGRSPFAAYLAEEQARRKLTARELLKLCTAPGGVSRNQLWRWRTQGQMPLPQAAERLLAILKTPDPTRSRLLHLVGQHMIETASKRDTSHPRATCKICSRTLPWHQAKRNATYSSQTNTFEHRHCHRRLAAWQKLKYTIGGLTLEDCQRFAAMPTVPVKCPTCGAVRKKPLNRLYPSSGPRPQKHSNRKARVRCRSGELLQECVHCHMRKVGRRPGVRASWLAVVAREVGGKLADELYLKAENGDAAAAKEFRRLWSVGARANRQSLPRKKGRTPTKSIGRILVTLPQRRFGLCRWCGLAIARRERLSSAPRPMFHDACFRSLSRWDPYRMQWRGMLRNPKRLARMERDPRTGRWKKTPVRGEETGLKGYFKGVVDRKWWAGVGAEPKAETLRLGCAGFIRRHAKKETHTTIAKKELKPKGGDELARAVKTVDNAVRIFEARAPGDWRSVFPGLTARSRAALGDLCPLPSHAGDRAAMVQDLATRRTPRDVIGRLTGVPATAVASILGSGDQPVLPEPAHAASGTRNGGVRGGGPRSAGNGGDD